MDNKCLIKNFKLLGLYGYKDIVMTFNHKTSIFVSENGAGKTTILNALYYLLDFDFEKLCEIKFESIEISFTDENNALLIQKMDLENMLSTISELNFEFRGVNGYFFNKSKNITSEINLPRVRHGKKTEELNNLTTVMSILSYRKGSLLNDDTFKAFSIRVDKMTLLQREAEYLQIRDFLEKIIPVAVKKLSVIHKKHLKSINIIYLPTYRRIEKLPDEIIELIESHQDDLENTLYLTDFRYGLDDVESELKRISRLIESKSSNEYRALSATMLDDLIQRKASAVDMRNLPDINDLERFLKRIYSKPSSRRRSVRDSLLNNLKEIYNNNEIDNYDYLLYFLSKLNKVINETKELEYKLEKFVSMCNLYLSDAGESKRIEINIETLQVEIIDNFNNIKIDFNDLSSGEKQIVSLMSMLYLKNGKNKLLLIDEPELSLSLKWQRRLLTDIDDNENLSQIVAITHSPFIFDNKLLGNAQNLTIHRKKIQ
ncbi:AAA family ATPase [Providencia sp. PROV091]|uniref:AAA family ATPase n=1 Tax=Providencia sp. PROV091 TaxID=2949807 RepID=UPI00234BAE83|nr:AAA family ATPase [Providencia sp. PROV091]